MSLTLQAKLLRVLQEMTFERVGSVKPIHVDMRLISATNRDPKQGVREGWFRPDLLYRLNVITLSLPPLREHKEDIPLLVSHFIKRYTQENHKPPIDISREAIQVLNEYDFPGNIRELKNIVERAVILHKGQKITGSDLPEEVINGSEAERENHGNSPIDEDTLLQALRRINLSANGGPPKFWHTRLKCTSIEKIHEFLIDTRLSEFSRVDFTRFLSQNGGSKRNKYGTAGKYLAILRKNRICVHNGEKANQSRFKLSEGFTVNV